MGAGHSRPKRSRTTNTNTNTNTKAASRGYYRQTRSTCTLDDGKWVCDTVNTGSDAPPPTARLLNGNSLIKMFDTGNFAFGTPGQTSPKNNEKKKKKSKSKKSGTR